MNTDRSRGNAGPPRGPARPPTGNEPDASSGGGGAFGNLGVLIQQALREQKPAAAPAEVSEPEEAAPPLKPCADCWHAKVFRRDGVSMARCELDLWVKPVVSNSELNANSVRRWYADCPEYDDSE